MIDKLKMMFGFVLLLSLVGLSATIAIGHVEEKTSYGLIEIIGIVGTLSGAFCNWAFGDSKKLENKDE